MIANALGDTAVSVMVQSRIHSWDNFPLQTPTSHVTYTHQSLYNSTVRMQDQCCCVIFYYPQCIWPNHQESLSQKVYWPCKILMQCHLQLHNIPKYAECTEGHWTYWWSTKASFGDQSPGQVIIWWWPFPPNVTILTKMACYYGYNVDHQLPSLLMWHLLIAGDCRWPCY